MCEPTTMLLLSAAATAGGTIMQQDAADDAANRQQNILRAGEEENQRINKSGEDVVNDFAEKTFGAENRANRYEDAAQGREKTLAEALTSASSGAGPAVSGNVSSDFLGAQSKSQADSMSDAAKRAKLLARSGAGGLMYGNESMLGGELSSDLAGLSQKSRRNASYTQNAAGAVRDQGSLAGGLLSGLGAAGMKYSAGQGLGLKYAGSSSNPLAANYTNSFDRM